MARSREWQMASRSSTYTHIQATPKGGRRSKRKTGCEDTLWLRSLAANINQFRAHPPPLRRLILTWCARKVSNARHRLVEGYVVFLSSHHVARRRFSISFMCSCDSENYHFTNDEIWCERLPGISTLERPSAIFLCSLSRKNILRQNLWHDKE